MQAYKEELLTNNSQGNQHQEHMKVISLPTFAKTHSLVLMDLATWQSYEVSFDFQLNEMVNQNIADDDNDLMMDWVPSQNYE